MPIAPQDIPLYEQIYRVVRQIPAGKVATYGQVAKITGGCTARMVGYALAALADRPGPAQVPWQRVINAQGKISPHGAGYGSSMQRSLLEAEGVEFDAQGRLDFNRFGWIGPLESTGGWADV
ncbi:MGMT family protein [Levilinea saccharolytica]|uniref:O(6)-alkylguanine repair protein YbaZ n=1 Tax=Levilinea saccharolytica TaxID=229921 RepID=A0A0M8JQM4_9CHLR|nr:MGMT family protein [Levilinea saccharolytica]KPL81632.1 hypothetical protein ADN01_09870 [Levilinea saccharolytica]GAP19552.1 O(6)-alkylguanine repair protein YbaZ [Levilinea saccharolytica]